MSAAQALQLISVDDYLASELISSVKHEYLGGVVYAMPGANNHHGLISGNIFGALYTCLRGKPCRPYNSDAKIRMRMPGQVRFYYPDVSVICGSNPAEESFQDEPVVICEVLSKSTRRIDEGEKRDAYLTIPSLSVYLLIEQDSAAVVVHRRTSQGYVREVYQGRHTTVPLPEIEAELPLGDIYEGVAFGDEPECSSDEATGH